MITPEQYLATMSKIAETGDLPALSIVRDLIAFDPNTLYRMGPGAAGELLDSALSRIDELTAQLDAAHQANQESQNQVRWLTIRLEEASDEVTH